MHASYVCVLVRETSSELSAFSPSTNPEMVRSERRASKL